MATIVPATVTEYTAQGSTDGTNTTGIVNLTVSPDRVHSLTDYTHATTQQFIVIPVNLTLKIKKITITGAAATIKVSVSNNANTNTPTYTPIAVFAFNPTLDSQATFTPDIVVKGYSSINSLGIISSTAVRFEWVQSTAAVTNITVYFELCL